MEYGQETEKVNSYQIVKITGKWKIISAHITNRDHCDRRPSACYQMQTLTQLARQY